MRAHSWCSFTRASLPPSPACCWSCCGPFSTPVYVAAWQAEELWCATLGIFPFWSVWVSHCGVRGGSWGRSCNWAGTLGVGNLEDGLGKIDSNL